AFSVRLPWDYREFLRVFDGAIKHLRNGRVSIFPVEQVNVEKVTVEAYNLSTWQGQHPLFVNGMDDQDDDIGFLREDLKVIADTCPVYAADHATWELTLMADSFQGLISNLSILRSQDDYSRLEPSS